MSNTPVRIVSLGKAVPKTVITNDDLTKILDTSDEWITTRTGIKQRHISSGDENSLTIGVEAAKEALSKANLKGEDIDLIIAATSNPYNIYPSTACSISSFLAGISSLERLYMMSTVSAPRRSAVRAASIATLPPPNTATRWAWKYGVSECSPS